MTEEISVASASFAAFSTNVGVTVTAERTRLYRISLTGAPTYINRTAADAGLRIVATTGTPEVVFAQEAYLYNSETSNSTHTSSASMIVELTAGETYTFRAEGRANGAGTDELRALFIFADRVGPGVALVAEEIE